MIFNNVSIKKGGGNDMCMVCSMLFSRLLRKTHQEIKARVHNHWPLGIHKKGNVHDQLRQKYVNECMVTISRV
jgi:hypothetical protein